MIKAKFEIDLQYIGLVQKTLWTLGRITYFFLTIGHAIEMQYRDVCSLEMYTTQRIMQNRDVCSAEM
jgi:hypothetical protein